MATLSVSTAFIGFGEAAMAFAEQWGPEKSAEIRAFDIKINDPATADAKRADYDRHKVRGTATLAEAMAKTSTIISVVTADQAHLATR